MNNPHGIDSTVRLVAAVWFAPLVEGAGDIDLVAATAFGGRDIARGDGPGVFEDLGDAHLVEGNAGGVERGEAVVDVPTDSSRDLDRFGDQLAGAGTVTVDRRVNSGRQKAKARRLLTPCHSQCIAHLGACRKTRVVP